MAADILFGFGNPRLLAILERDALYPTAQALLDEIRLLYRQLLAECARPSRQPVLVEPEEMEITAAGPDRG